MAFHQFDISGYEIVDYIIACNGPDEERRGHPKVKRLMYDDLDSAITIAQDKGFCKDVKPYHFHWTFNTYNHSWIVDEVLVKKIDQLLTDKYQGNLVKGL